MCFESIIHLKTFKCLCYFYNSFCIFIKNLDKMTIALKTYTHQDFIKFVERAEAVIEDKFEFVGGQMLPVHFPVPLEEDLIDYILSDSFDENQRITNKIASIKLCHGKLISNLHGKIGMATLGKNVNIYSQGTYVYIEITGSVRVPDLVLTNANHEKSTKNDELLNPKSIVEVFSKSTKSVDKADKLTEYQSIESLIEYIMIDPTKPLVTVRYRANEHQWQEETLDAMNNVLHFKSIDFSISLSEIYEGVVFEN